ncbi:hypothetical protein CWI38_0671p0020, partial [Hamiltosporidium tvaerminnensis]
MGILNSRVLCEEEIEDLLATTVFTKQEINILFQRFRMLNRSQQNYITFNELMLIPEFHSNPLSGLILSAIENYIQYENMTFAYFLDFMQLFSHKTDKKERIKFIFSAFDINKDKKICKDVLLNIYTLMNGNSNICIEQAEASVYRVLSLYDRGNKGYLSYKDFIRFYTSDPSLDKAMVIDFSREIERYPKFGFRQFFKL